MLSAQYCPPPQSASVRQLPYERHTLTLPPKKALVGHLIGACADGSLTAAAVDAAKALEVEAGRRTRRLHRAMPRRDLVGDPRRRRRERERPILVAGQRRGAAHPGGWGRRRGRRRPYALGSTGGAESSAIVRPPHAITTRPNKEKKRTLRIAAADSEVRTTVQACGFCRRLRATPATAIARGTAWRRGGAASGDDDVRRGVRRRRGEGSRRRLAASKEPPRSHRSRRSSVSSSWAVRYSSRHSTKKRSSTLGACPPGLVVVRAGRRRRRRRCGLADGLRPAVPGDPPGRSRHRA